MLAGSSELVADSRGRRAHEDKPATQQNRATAKQSRGVDTLSLLVLGEVFISTPLTCAFC